MNWESSKSGRTQRPAGLLLAVLFLLAGTSASFAITPAPFAPLRQWVTNDLATLSAITNPTPAQRFLLNTLRRANDVLNDATAKDGKALAKINTLIRRDTNCIPLLNTVASNLVSVFNNEYNFVGGLLNELPPSTNATKVLAAFNALTPIVSRLNTNVSAAKTAPIYDAAKGRLDTVLILANQASFIPFPFDLPFNSVFARVNDVALRSTRDTASDNVFAAETDGTNTSITVNAIDYPRGVQFSIPTVPVGTSARYGVPITATFISRTGIYLPTENSVAATAGSFFVSSTTNEVYGTFSCSGPGFTVTDGRFRITLTPAAP